MFLFALSTLAPLHPLFQSCVWIARRPVMLVLAIYLPFARGALFSIEDGGRGGAQPTIAIASANATLLPRSA